MDSDEKSLNSMPTMADPNGGARRPAKPFEEHSIGSAPTMGGRTTPQGGRLRPGDVLLGRYTMLAELGEGGMGVVYKCLDTIGGIEVAIKCLPPELSRNESEMEGIRENYAIVARLHHSAISGLRQLEKDSEFGEYYLVMDLAKGEDLSTILRRRRGVPMPLDEALAILRPLASALDYAHGEHVLHRDVKPANVKVDGSRVQLLDFGLAAEVRSSMSRVSLRGHAGSSGTPAYMAPEQWEARRQSAATDQYSLAVMAYEMLSGYRPFDTDNMELLKSAVLTRAPEEIEGVPAYVNAALQKALAKNPKERFASCTEFVEAISNAEPQSVQRDFHTEAQRHGESISGAAKPESRIPHPTSTPPISEADVLRRKLALTRAIKAIAAENRADKEFSKFVGKAEDELAVAEEACKFGRFAVAAESLNVAENALCDLQTAKQAREEAERRAREEAERKAREEAERKAREAAERKARIEAGRRAWQEQRRKARQEVREEAERKAREEAARWDRDKIARMERDQAATDRKTILMTFFAIAALIIGIGWYFLYRLNKDGAMRANTDAPRITVPPISTSQSFAAVANPAAHPMAFRQEVETSHKETAERSNDDTSANALIIHKQIPPNGTIRMITEATFPPYEFRLGKEIVGIDVEICKAIAKELGKKLEIVDVEFDSVLPSVIEGKAELAAAGITIIEDRKRYVDFSIPYERTGIVFVYAKDKPFEKGEDAKGKMVGVQNGTTSADYVRKNLGQEPEMFDSPASAFAALKAGKVDVMIADIDPARAVVKGQVGYAISDLLTVEEYAVAIKKGQPELLATINKVIQRLRDSGELDKITDDMTAKANEAFQ